MQDIRPTILSQYANSPRLCGIIGRFNAASDPRALIEIFLQQVWNPQTATGWGLDVWGRIVGVPRTFKIIPQDYWGFEEALDIYGTSRPFNDGIFYSDEILNGTFTLPDETYRQLIFAKAAANITNGSIKDLNRLFMLMFGRKGRIWVADDGPMRLCVFYDWALEPIDAAIIVSSGILPRPTGVIIRYERVFDSS